MGESKSVFEENLFQHNLIATLLTKRKKIILLLTKFNNTFCGTYPNFSNNKNTTQNLFQHTHIKELASRIM